jgi:hypothetical protein
MDVPSLGRMSRQKAIYEVTHAETGEVLSGHRTRQAAVDAWRVYHSSQPVKIIRWLAIPTGLGY